MASRGMISLGSSASGVRSAAFSPDGAVLAIGSNDGAVRVWAWRKDVKKPAADRHCHAGAVRSVAFGQDGSALASAGDDGTVRLWHAPDWAATRTLTAHAASLQTVTFSSDGALLAAGGDDGTVQVWDMNRCGAPGVRMAGHTGCVCSVAFRPDGAMLAAGGDDGTVRIWDTHTSELRSKLTGHTGAVRTVAFSSDGAALAAGADDGTVRIWDTHTSELRSELTGQTGAVRTVAFSSDGAMLAAGADDGTIWVWDVDTGELGSRLAGHVGQVWSVAYSSKDIYAAVGREREMRVWKVGPRPRWRVWRQAPSWRQALKPIPEIFEWYKSNAAAGTLFLGVYLVVKGYVIAKGDLSTALGILEYAGLASVVIAGLLSALPILIAAMFAFTIYRTILATRVTRRGLHVPAIPLVVVTVTAAVLCAVFTPWTFMVGAALIGLVTGTGRRLFEGPLAAWRRTRMAVVPPVGLILLAGTVAAVVAMLYTVWVPHEIVDFTPGPNGQPPSQEVGYVLAEGGGSITILTSGAHQIVRFNDSAAKSFELCERGPGGGWSDVANAATLWQEATRASFLNVLHAAANAPCFPPQRK